MQVYLRFFILVFFWMPLGSFAQTFRYNQYSTLQGLPIDNVFTAAQDGDGFIWFSTDFGISRFDGYRFTNFFKENGLANTAVIDIAYAGGDSLIFISYPNTVQAIHYDGRINTLDKFSGSSLQKLTKHYNQFYFLQRKVKLFGIFENGKMKQYDLNDYLHTQNTTINSIISLGERGVAFCTTKGLFIKNGEEVKQYLENENVTYLAERSNKTIVAVYNNNIVEGDVNFNFKKLPYNLPQNYNVLHMVEDADGTIWFRADDKGVFKLENSKLEDVSSRLGLQNKIVNSFFVDSEKNTWFCTDGAGILFKKKSAFVNYETQDGLVNNKILSLLKHKNKLFIGTSNGLSIKENNSITTVALPKYSKGLNYVFKLLNTSNAEAGICTSNDYKFLANGKEDKYFKNINYKNANLNVFSNSSLFAWGKTEKETWFTYESSLMRMVDNKIAGIFTMKSFPIQKVYSMISYGGKTWLGAKGGLFTTTNNNNFEKIDSIENTKIDLVFQFLADKKNRLWIATENGLFLYENKKYKKVQIGNTQSGNYCQSITEDNDGKIWCATWDGVFVIDDKNVLNYSTAEGIVSKICNTILYDSATNNIYIGTDNGLSEVHKNGLFSFAIFNSVYINCKVADSIEIKNDNKLASHQNNLNFYFSLPFYQGISSLKYEYKLDNGEWNNTALPNIFLSDINTGSHKLYVRAKKNGIVCTKRDAVFSFTIAKPFYTTWWFWLIIFLASQFLFYKTINHYNKKAREEKLQNKMQQAEYASLKQQAFTSLMNPHFIFNALNSVQHYVNRQDRKSANKYLSDFATLIRKNFDAAQKSFVSLEEELETIRLYLALEKMRFSDKFDYEIILTPEAEEEEWMLPSMVLQPFLENSIIHGLMPLTTKGILTIHASVKNDALFVVISDNGVGMEKSKLYKTNKKHVSRGMQLIKERLEILSLIGKEPITLAIKPLQPSAHNEGTKVELRFPISVYEAFQQQALKR